MVNRVDEFANSLQGDNHIERLEEWLAHFDLSTCTSDEKQSWHHLYGIIPFQKGDDEEALRRFTQGHRECPDFQPITFSLGQQYVRANEIERAFSLFARCEFPALPREFTMMIIRYAYLYDRRALALEYLDQFLPGFKQLKILDDHFLYVRGMPFFGSWLGDVLAVSMLQKDFTYVDDVLKWVKANASDYHEESIAASVEYAKTGDFSALVNQSNSYLAEYAGSQMPMGFHLARVAVGGARDAKNYEDAIQVLDRLTVGANDHQWLNDMLILAKYELSQSYKRTDALDGYEFDFMARQSLLFEPNLVLSFGMVGTQEELVCKYFSGN